MQYNVYALYFSPTDNTMKTVREVARGLADKLSGGDYYSIDLTPKKARRAVYEFGPEDIVVFGVPVYAGRVPNKLEPYIAESVYGDGALAVPVVTYGNRAYDDALKELACILYDNGMDILGASAVPAEHSFTKALAEGRPNESDLTELYEYGKSLAVKTESGKITYLNPDSLPGRPYEEIQYYVPLKEDGERAAFLKAMPKTDASRCASCGLCRELCPMGCYDDSLTEPAGICIKCHGCIKKCPIGAKSFAAEDLESHIRMLENNYADKVREIELF